MRWKWPLLILLFLSLPMIGLGRALLQSKTVILTGQVFTDQGAASHAVVRVQTADTFTVTDKQGYFELETDTFEKPLTITAWLPGYYNGSAEITRADQTIEITLEPHFTTDNPEYAWFSKDGIKGIAACAICHEQNFVDEWRADAHAQAAVNPRFLSLYRGTDLSGQQGQPTLYNFDPGAGIDIPLAPSLGQDNVGAGFRLDYPDLGGNCANCHAPAAALRQGGAHTDLDTLSDIEREGIFCDFCHKIGDVLLDPVTGLPDPNRPGVLSMRLYRPAGEDQIFFGNYDDVNAGPDTYRPLFEESAFCAPCHTGTFWGTTVYNSFGEWLESPYSDPETGKTCQDCHMPTVNYARFSHPQAGGLERDTIFSHKMPGAMDTALLQETAELEVEARCEADQLNVTVRVTNAGAGHHLPTDNPLRNVILVVRATTLQGELLSLENGTVIPEWGGVGDPAQGYYAGMPGVLYAKILADFYTDEMPTPAYWRQTRLVSDNRIPALATDETHYTFSLPDGDCAAVVEVQLLLRRAFIDLMDQKDWDTSDLLMEQVRLEVGE